jgi:hypothetical protein
MLCPANILGYLFTIRLVLTGVSCGVRRLAAAVCRPGLPGRAPHIHHILDRTGTSDSRRYPACPDAGRAKSRAFFLRAVCARRGTHSPCLKPSSCAESRANLTFPRLLRARDAAEGPLLDATVVTASIGKKPVPQKVPPLHSVYRVPETNWSTGPPSNPRCARISPPWKSDSTGPP